MNLPKPKYKILYEGDKWSNWMDDAQFAEALNKTSASIVAIHIVEYMTREEYNKWRNKNDND